MDSRFSPILRCYTPFFLLFFPFRSGKGVVFPFPPAGGLRTQVGGKRGEGGEVPGRPRERVSGKRIPC